jgi:hypothetical protein
MNNTATDTISHAALVNVLGGLEANMVTSLSTHEDSGKVGKEVFIPSVSYSTAGR